jgi:hypothetical protein
LNEPGGPAAPARVLPDQAPPFVAAETLRTGDGFLRRTYVLGQKRVEITVARMVVDESSYQDWLAGAREYPPVELPLPPEQGSGFFTCARDGEESVCDFHIQFRSGFHVEGMGNGRVPKAELQELLAHLPLSVLSDPAALVI